MHAACTYTEPTILVDWASTFTASPHSHHYCLYWTFSKSMSINVNVLYHSKASIQTIRKSTLLLLNCSDLWYPLYSLWATASPCEGNAVNSWRRSSDVQELSMPQPEKAKVAEGARWLTGWLTLFQCAKLLKMSIKNWCTALQQLNASIRKSTRYVS